MHQSGFGNVMTALGCPAIFNYILSSHAYTLLMKLLFKLYITSHKLSITNICSHMNSLTRGHSCDLEIAFTPDLSLMQRIHTGYANSIFYLYLLMLSRKYDVKALHRSHINNIVWSCLAHFLHVLQA